MRGHHHLAMREPTLREQRLDQLGQGRRTQIAGALLHAHVVGIPDERPPDVEDPGAERERQALGGHLVVHPRHECERPREALAARPRSALPHGYQGIGSRFRKKPPVGPSSGRVASQTAVSAPSSTERGALLPPMSVRTHPGHIELTRIPFAPSSWERILVRALSAVFETR